MSSSVRAHARHGLVLGAVMIAALVSGAARPSPAHAGGGCSAGYVCLYTNADYRGDVDSTLSAGLAPLVLRDMASSWQNLTRYTLCAYDRHWWGYEKLWTMPPRSSHNWVGTAANDRADATGPC